MPGPVAHSLCSDELRLGGSDLRFFSATMVISTACWTQYTRSTAPFRHLTGHQGDIFVQKAINSITSKLLMQEGLGDR
jgi:hypothetical protein